VIAYAAHLRVYSPLGAFPEPQRRMWNEYVESGAAPSRPVLLAMEHDAGLAAAAALPPRVTLPAARHAYVRHLDGLTYVCPWALQQRGWRAWEEFGDALPDEIAEAFVPAPVAADAELEHESWVADHPDAVPAIRTSTWTVPIPWFALFEPAERRLVLGERRAAGAATQTGLDRALVYLTAMSRARRRVARALTIVRRAFDDVDAGPVEELARWLEEFHPHALVELDYGGIVHLLDDDALAADDSVALVAEALERLAAGDAAAAGGCYEQVLARWRAVAALEHAN
jgi:hypothetical protein